MKKSLLLIFLFARFVPALHAQDEDSTHYLFKQLKVSYLQYTIGYERLNFQNEKTGLNAFYASFFGLVFNDKIALGLDMNAANHPYATFSPGERYPKTSTYISIALNVEPLIKPKKLFNLSVPITIGFAAVTQWDTIMDFAHPWGSAFTSTQLGYQVNLYDNSFLVASAGLNGFVNLWKPLSLGAGVRYRYSVDLTRSIRNPDISGLSWSVVLRWKWDYKAYNKKMMERQREWMQNNQH